MNPVSHPIGGLSLSTHQFRKKVGRLVVRRGHFIMVVRKCSFGSGKDRILVVKNVHDLDLTRYSFVVGREMSMRFVKLVKKKMFCQ